MTKYRAVVTFEGDFVDLDDAGDYIDFNLHAGGEVVMVVVSDVEYLD